MKYTIKYTSFAMIMTFVNGAFADDTFANQACHNQTTLTNEIPESAVPALDGMKKICNLIGRWSVVSESSQDDGNTWKVDNRYNTNITADLHGLMLSEVPENSVNVSPFKMHTYLSYDQYRNVYRKSATGTGWGVMDIYEGTIENNKLIMTNLKAGTLFPVDNSDKQIAFRLRLDLTGDTRELWADVSTDNGQNWNDAYKVTYSRLGDTHSVDEMNLWLEGWLTAYQKFNHNEFIKYYADTVIFKDPTAGLTLTSKKQVSDFYNTIMKNRYGTNFTFSIDNKAFSHNAVSISGTFSLTYNDKVTSMPFSTWLTFENGKIIKQLDMFDYATMRNDLGIPLQEFNQRQ